MYNPLDFWPIVQRAFAMIRPARIVLVEAEVWPNLAAGARARGIPLALVNARLLRALGTPVPSLPAIRRADVSLSRSRLRAGDGEISTRWEGLGVPRSESRKSAASSTIRIEAQRDATLPRAKFFALRHRSRDAADPASAAARTRARKKFWRETFLRLRERISRARSDHRTAACRTHGARVARSWSARA